MLSTKTFDAIKATGDDVKDLKLNNWDKSYSRFIDDQWSGTEIKYYIDQENDLLIKKISNDSPEQAGGWVEMYAWFKNEWRNLSNMADIFSYAIIDDELYLIEFDRELQTYNTTMTLSVATSRNGQHNSFFLKKFEPHVMDELVNKLRKEVREFAVKEFKAGGFLHYVFDGEIERYIVV